MCISGEQIGSEPTLPYLNPELTGEKLLVGANFASAGIGILNDTGIQFVSTTFLYVSLLKFIPFLLLLAAKPLMIYTPISLILSFPGTYLSHYPLSYREIPEFTLNETRKDNSRCRKRK